MDTESTAITADWTIVWEPQLNSFLVTPKGFWTEDKAKGFCDAMLALAYRHIGAPVDLLLDLRHIPTQPAAVVDRISRLSDEIRSMGIRRIAIISASALSKLQQRRIDRAISDENFFSSVVAARAWLAA